MPGRREPGTEPDVDHGAPGHQQGQAEDGRGERDGGEHDGHDGDRGPFRPAATEPQGEGLPGDSGGRQRDRGRQQRGADRAVRARGQLGCERVPHPAGRASPGRPPA